MATLPLIRQVTDAYPGNDIASTVNLSSAQTGTGASTNVCNRGIMHVGGPSLIQIVSTVGATPTVTVAIQGSADGTNWFAIGYADSATPGTVSVATFTITTATTVWKIIQPNVPAQFIRLLYSANTNVTLTADIYFFGV
jgi:hypothetical protein